MSETELVKQALGLPADKKADLIATLIHSIEDDDALFEQELISESKFIDQQIEEGHLEELSEEDFYKGVIKNRS